MAAWQYYLMEDKSATISKSWGPSLQLKCGETKIKLQCENNYMR